MGVVSDRLLALAAARLLPHALHPAAPHAADFHFCRLFAGDEAAVARTRHQHYLCALLGLRPGLAVLQLGAGVGDVALELVRYADVDVVGVEEDVAKIEYATKRVQDARLSHRISFVHATLDDLAHNLPHAAFDVIYAIESLKTAPDPHALYTALLSLLKPGGKLGFTTWAFTAPFAPSSPDHARLAALLSATAHLPSLPCIDDVAAALEDAGLAVLYSADMSARRDKIAWWAPLERALGDARMAWADADECDGEGREGAFGGLSRTAAGVVVQAAKWKLFTPMAVFVAQRPLGEVKVE